MRQVRNPVQLNFERNGDLLFHFLRRMARPLRDDLRIGISHVGIRFNRQVVKRNNAPHEQHERSAQHQQPAVQSDVDGLADHLLFLLSYFFSATSLENSSAFATTSSPAFTPSRISCKPSGASPSACTTTRRKLPPPSLRKTQSLSCKRIIAVAGTTTRSVIKTG